MGAKLELSPLRLPTGSTLAVAQQCPPPSAREHSIFGKYFNLFKFLKKYLKLFKIYGVWPQASMYINTLPQYSPASVRLAQARGSPEMEDKKWVVNHTAACMLIRFIYDACVHISLYLTTKECSGHTDNLVLENARWIQVGRTSSMYKNHVKKLHFILGIRKVHRD